MKDRTNLLRQLLILDRPARDLATELSTFAWDIDEELVVLTVQHVRAILERFSAGGLTAQEVSVWAESIEQRDDIGFERGHEVLIKDILFELANPDINAALTLQRAETLARHLR